jgi:hypothetical protein
MADRLTQRAAGCYLQGHAIGPERDQGWNGINAAFVLDLMMREQIRQASASGMRSLVTDEPWVKAYEIRRTLAEVLPGLPGRDGLAWLRQQWWYYATLAEALFGLGRYDEAVATLRCYNQAHGLDAAQPPVETVPAWEFESTITSSRH